MADDRTKKPNEPSVDSMSPLERYLAKQKQDKAAQAAKDASAAPRARTPLGKSSQKASPAPPPDPRAKLTAGYGPNEAPSLSNIERPASPTPPASTPSQPPSLKRWESVAESRLSESEQRAREAGAPTPPPAYQAAPRESRAETFANEPSPSAADRIRPITDSQIRPDGISNASFGPRLVAAIIDGTILLTLSWVAKQMVFTLVAIVFGAILESRRDGLGWLTSLCMTYAYYGYFYPMKGASPGKMMIGLEVVDTDGVTRLTPWKAFFREAIGKTISAIPFFMGFVIALIRVDHRALHDLLFDTRVIRKTETGA